MNFSQGSEAWSLCDCTWCVRWGRRSRRRHSKKVLEPARRRRLWTGTFPPDRRLPQTFVAILWILSTMPNKILFTISQSQICTAEGGGPALRVRGWDLQSGCSGSDPLTCRVTLNWGSEVVVPLCLLWSLTIHSYTHSVYATCHKLF